MRLISYEHQGASGVGVMLDNERFVALSKAAPDLPSLPSTMRGILALGLLVALAALTSTISLLEVVVSYFIDERKMSRPSATLLSGGAIFVFVALIYIYARASDKADEAAGLAETAETTSTATELSEPPSSGRQVMAWPSAVAWRR